MRYVLSFPNFGEYSRALGALKSSDCGPRQTISATEKELEVLDEKKINYLFL